MDLIIFAVMTAVTIFIVYKNVSLFKRMKHNNHYVECYKAMLAGDEGAHEMILNTIESEPSTEFKNKTRIFQLYSELEKDPSGANCLNDIDLRDIFYTKDKLDRQKVTLNSDTFMWVMLVMVRARKYSRFDVIDKLSTQILNAEDLNNRLEYKMVDALAKVLKEDESGIRLFKDLLEGNTYQLAHDKQLIVLYKRMDAAVLDANSEPFDEYYKEDLVKFTTSLIGSNFMKDMGNYDKYHKEDETVEEATSETEEVRENTEE